MKPRKVIAELSQEDLHEMSGILHGVMRNEVKGMADHLLCKAKTRKGGTDALGIILDVAMAKPAKLDAVKKAPRKAWWTVLVLISIDKKIGTETFDHISFMTVFDDGSAEILTISLKGIPLRQDLPAVSFHV